MVGPLKPCCGGDLQSFTTDDGFRMYGKVYVPLGYHYIDTRTFVCFEEVRTGERVDIWLSAFHEDLATGLFENLEAMSVVAEAAS